MAYDLEEQEQIAQLKAWWNQNGNLVTWVLVAALGAYACWTGWQAWQRTQAAQASQLHDELEKGVAEKDNAKVQRAAADIEDKFARTTYAEMSGLAAAKSAFESNDLTAARAQLQWVIDHGADEEYRVIARVRLAGILLDQKEYDAGLALLAGDFAPQFASLVADRKGDILVAQNKIAEAREAYKLALDKAGQKNPGRQMIQMKLDAIGGTAGAAA